MRFAIHFLVCCAASCLGVAISYAIIAYNPPLLSRAHAKSFLDVVRKCTPSGYVTIAYVPGTATTMAVRITGSLDCVYPGNKGCNFCVCSFSTIREEPYPGASEPPLWPWDLDSNGDPIDPQTNPWNPWCQNIPLECSNRHPINHQSDLSPGTKARWYYQTIVQIYFNDCATAEGPPDRTQYLESSYYDH